MKRLADSQVVEDQAVESQAAEEQVAERRARPVLVAVRAVAFLALAAVLFVYLNAAFVMKGTVQTRGAFDAYYNLESETADVVYLGTSATSRFFIPPKAFHDHGIALFEIGPNFSPTYYQSWLMRETSRAQSPRLFVIELRAAHSSPTQTDDGSIRKTLDMMDLFSPNRLPMAVEAQRYSPEEGKSLAEYLFPIVKYHGRLLQGDMTADDFLLKAPVNKMQGFASTKLSLKQEPQEPAVFTDEVGALPDGVEPELAKLCDYCDGIDADVLFVMSPASMPLDAQESLNAAAQFVSSRGYPVLNCNNDAVFEEIGLDWSTDFYNEQHTNVLGAEKYTEYLSRYLDEHYDLPDRRGDAAYSAWDDGFSAYTKFASKGVKKKQSGDEDEM